MQELQSAASFRQPRHALKPDAFTLESAEEWALERASHLSPDRFRLSSFWYIDFGIQHVPGERRTYYAMRLAQSENYGLACGLISGFRDEGNALANRESDHAFIGEDSRSVLKDKRVHADLDRTALIDSVMGHISAPASDQVILDQALHDKYAVKSRLFADEADILLRRKGSDAVKGGKPRILVIGAMAGTIKELIDRGYEVSATDMSPEVVGRNLGGVMIGHASENDRLIEVADLAIITGMTFANRTLPTLIEKAKINNTSTMMWAVTGKNCGYYYTEQGIDCVISDPSPFFYLPGPTSIGIWRREH
jgi:Putative heavy-metal chelation